MDVRHLPGEFVSMVVAVMREIDVVNGGDERANRRRCMLGIGFHHLKFKLGSHAAVMGCLPQAPLHQRVIRRGDFSPTVACR